MVGGASPTAEADRERMGSLSGWNWLSTHILHTKGLLLQPLHSQDILNGDATEGLITCNKEGGRVVFSCTACPQVGGSPWPRDSKAMAEGFGCLFPKAGQIGRARMWGWGGPGVLRAQYLRKGRTLGLFSLVRSPGTWPTPSPALQHSKPV